MKDTSKPYTKKGIFNFILFGFFLLATNLASAQVVKYSNDFLRIGVGAKEISSAGAVVSNTQSASAGFWNPAGIARMNKNYDIVSMHSEYFFGMANYDYIGAAHKIDSTSAVAINIVRFGVDNIQNTLELFDSQGNIDYSRISKFSVADYAIFASYARNSSIEGLSVGGSLKVIYRQQGEFASAWGVGLDAGMQFHRNKWKFGAVLRDISTTTTVWSFQADKLLLPYDTLGLSTPIPSERNEVAPPSLSVGTSRKFIISNKWQLLPAIDIDIFFDGQRNTLVSSSFSSLDFRTSVRLEFEKLAYLNIGAHKFQYIQSIDGKKELRFSPTVGVGFTYWDIRLDYALGNVANFGGGRFSNYFSISYSFQ